jgi:hypothetical protein
MKLQKVGGWASLIYVCAWIAYVGIEGFIVPRLGLSLLGGDGPVKEMAVYEASPTIFHVVQLSMLLNGFLFVLVALALQERMRSTAPNLMGLTVIAASVAFALMLADIIIGFSGVASIVSAKDVSAWRAGDVVRAGLGSTGGNAWGWALLSIGWAAITTRKLPRILSWIILVDGVMTIIQFALWQIQPAAILLLLISMFWLGIVLLRKPEPDLG